MFTSLINLVTEALKLWNNKEKNKYADRAIYLKKAYYEEFNKDPALRSDAVLDNLEFELRVLADSISSRLREQNP